METLTLRYFKLDEFKCKCCGKSQMDIGTLRKLDNIRHELRKPMLVSSGYRCPHHNDSVSSTGMNGPHTTGQAVDILISGKDAYDLILVAYANGMTGIGVSQKGPHTSRFIHLDDLETNRPTIWSY
jgi:uncharacterized protein YcbK (DUF882 family)